jgi:hypothetical protein
MYEYVQGLGQTTMFQHGGALPSSSGSQSSSTIASTGPLSFMKHGAKLSLTPKMPETKVASAKLTAAPSTSKPPTTAVIRDLGIKARTQSSAADLASARIKSLEDKIAALTSTLASAQQSGAPSAEVQHLQQQVANLTAALSAAQQEHIAAAQAAAALHREEMSALQMQIAELASAMTAAQTGGNGEAAGQVAAMQAQIAMLQQQLAAAGQAAEAEEQAAAETAATAQPGFFEQHRNTLLIAGAAVAVAGAAYWFFLRRKPAAGLPAPTTSASPSGLAANPMQRVKSYRRSDGTLVKAHVRRTKKGPRKPRRYTKAAMRRMGWKHDIYTGEVL